jgi:hypothetical protein
MASNIHNGQDRRRYTRIRFIEAVTLKNKSGEQYQGTLLDICFKGALVECPENWQGRRSDVYHLELLLSDSDIIIHMDCEVAHVTRNHAGFSCRHIDLESMTHLRRLVELNLGSDELLLREFSALIANHTPAA